jgi:hypothetical protein
LAGLSEVTSIADVAAGGSGYFYIDYEAGVLFVYEAGGDAVPTGFTDGTTTITYYNYEDAATGSANSAMVLGDVNPGDWLTFDDNSNYIQTHIDIGTASGGANGDVYAADPDYGAGADATISAQLEATMEELARTVGQVLAVWEWPRSGLNKVRTQYSGLTSTERMPGTATEGMPYSTNISGGSNKVVIINFSAR